MDNPFKSPNVLSLCTGMRGLERGLERAIGNINTVAYVEIEAFIIWNLVKQMEQGVLAPAPIWSNLKTFPWREFHGKIHGIIGGYPCQPFSVAGKQKGIEDPRHLWPYIKEGIQSIRPVWCFFENVPGHINIGFREVKSDLESMGYSVEAGIYSASEVRAPHLRKRLFILAKLADTRHSELSGWIEINERQQPDGGRESRSVITPQSVYNREKLADTTSARLSGQSWRSKESRFTEPGFGDMWPSRPGEIQHEWERSRTKSRMGFTINGYSFREDLLRMAGNGVVEQTAELAFIDLIRKHGLTPFS